MFRRLFVIETAALQISDADQAARHQSEQRVGENVLELARFASSPSRYGMWSSRATH